MKKTIIGSAVTLGAIVAVVLWQNGAHGPAQTRAQAALRIAINPWIGNGLFYVARDKGFFARERSTVELVNVDDSATVRQLIQTGKVDAGYWTPEAVVILADAGVPVKVFAASDRSWGADGVVAAPDIKTVSDLKGKTVAFEVGSTSHLLLSVLLKEVGMSTADLHVINTLAPDAGAAFVAGKVDAAVTWEPWLSKAKQRDGGHVLASSRDVPIIYDMLIFRADRAQSRKKDIEAVYRALFKTQEWIAANQQEAAVLMANAFAITPEEARLQMQGVHWLTLTENQQGLTSGKYSVRNAIQIAGDLWRELGLIKRKFNSGEIVDASLLKSVSP